MLQKFNLPKVDAWENEDYVSAMEVLIDFYVGGPDTVPAVADILPLMSEKIRNDRSKKQEAQKKKQLAEKRKRKFAGKQTSLLSFVKRSKKS